MRTISCHNQKTNTTAQLYCTLSTYVTQKTKSRQNLKTNTTPLLYCTLSTLVCKTNTYSPLEPKTDTTTQLEKKFLQPMRNECSIVVSYVTIPCHDLCISPSPFPPDTIPLNQAVLNRPAFYQSKTIRGTNYYEGPIFLYILFLCTFSLNSTCSPLGRSRATLRAVVLCVRLLHLWRERVL